jgi:putative kinase
LTSYKTFFILWLSLYSMSGPEIPVRNIPEKNFNLVITGQPLEINVPQEQINTVHRPLLTSLLRLAWCNSNERTIAFIAGPPGSGKSVLSALWTELKPTISTSVSMQVLPMDGFHRLNEDLEAHEIEREGKRMSLRMIKGAPETFDLANFSEALQQVRMGKQVKWPLYDRQKSAPIPDAFAVNNHGLLLVEGNYLLLNENGWRDLPAFADTSIFIKIPEHEVREGIVRRRIQTERTPEVALEEYLRIDQPNYHRVIENSLPADALLSVQNRQFRIEKTPPFFYT